MLTVLDVDQFCFDFFIIISFLRLYGVSEFRQYDFRQLDIRQWRKSENLLARVQWKLVNWRKFRGYAGESPVDSCQLANIQDFIDESPPYFRRLS